MQEVKTIDSVKRSAGYPGAQRARVSAAGEKRGRRIDLFEKIPLLERICKSRYLQFLLILPNLAFFYFFLIAGVFGSPVGNRNILIIFVWIFWWFLLITIMVPFLSRIWCAVCPFPFFGEWFQRRAFIKVRPGRTGYLRNKLFGLNLKWPKALSNIWLQNIGFLAICSFSVLTLTRPIVSVVVLGGLFVIATVLSMIFRQRAFCLYVCPVSGFQGLYSMVSTLALRPRNRAVCNRIHPGGDYSFEHGIAACRLACPAAVDSSGYVHLVQSGDYQGALRLIHEAIPFASVCGRVCHHPCEGGCLRGEIDESISIGRIKRFVAENADWDACLREAAHYAEGRKESKKVAVVGAGPSGLTCAYHLARAGYGVTVYEAQEVAGGMLRVAIPEYRLPADIVDKEIDFIRAHGVKIVTNVAVGKQVSFDKLKEDFDSVYVSVGASMSRPLGIKGEELEGVLSGLDFLRRAKLRRPVEVGERVAVIGGGDTAIDSARSALRMGARQVVLVYRRSREHMPAVKHEIEEALAEGIRIEELAAPVKISGPNGRAATLRCARMQLAAADASGRPRPVAVEGAEFNLDIDTVIVATGQMVDGASLPGSIADGKGGTAVAFDPESQATPVPGVFAGGDGATGPGMLIDAIAAGRKAAQSIQRFLRGEALAPVTLHPATIAVKQLPQAIVETRARHNPALLPISKRRDGFAEVENTLTEQQAREEADRCLSCGICGACYRGTEKGWGCPWMQRMGSMDRNNYCGLCMECVKSCPHDNIGLYLRPFAEDNKIHGYDEAWKAFIMVALALVYAVVFLGPWGTVKDWANVSEARNFGGFLAYISIIWSMGLAVIPGLFGLASWAGKRLAGDSAVSVKDLFVRYSFVMVPFGLLAWIAFSFPLVMINGAYILSVASDPLGWGWDLLHTAHIPWTPILPEYTVHLQIVLLLGGLALSLKSGYEISGKLYQDTFRRVKSLLPVAILCLIFTIAFITLFAGQLPG